MEILEKLNELIWGLPALMLTLGVGIYLTATTRMYQIRKFPVAVKNFINKLQSNGNKVDSVSAYQALCTALAATVGTGNLAGVAGAIAIGGPGAVFWMWVCAILGMITKFAEVTLALRYREKNPQGEFVGGPMYIIQNGLGERFRWLAVIYAAFGVIAALGVGNATQINTVIGGIVSTANAYGVAVPNSLCLLIACSISVIIGKLLLGGAKRIAKIAEKLVPFAAILYLLLCVGVLIVRADEIPNAFGKILIGAFSPKAVTGGALGSFFVALRVGASRGVFTNEAGMGTASIAHASSDVTVPVEQGLMGMMEVFIDTILICTMTALVILCSGVSIEYGIDSGINLTISAFRHIYGSWSSMLITAILCCLAIATVIGWGLYGARCAQFLFDEKSWRLFVYIQMMIVVISAVLKTGTVWILSEIINGLMCIPNLVAVLLLSPQLFKVLRKERMRLSG